MFNEMQHEFTSSDEGLAKLTELYLQVQADRGNAARLAATARGVDAGPIQPSRQVGGNRKRLQPGGGS